MEWILRIRANESGKDILSDCAITNGDKKAGGTRSNEKQTGEKENAGPMIRE
jgi:hypothetical protein